MGKISFPKTIQGGGLIIPPNKAEYQSNFKIGEQNVNVGNE